MYRAAHTALCHVHCLCAFACMCTMYCTRAHTAYWLSHLDPLKVVRKRFSLFPSFRLNVRGGVLSATNEKRQLDRPDRSAVGLV